MATLVLSDLHLGAVLGGDVLRRRAVRERLLGALDGIDRVVLLGDVLELREQPLATVLACARPFFEDLGEALDGVPVTIVPGNHDHQLAAPLIESRRLRARPAPLGLEETARAGRTGPLGAIARRMPRSEVTVAYPGVWLRPDVYALHGHYLDCHMAVPRAEVVAVSAIRRLLRRGRPRTVEEHEAVLAPLYALGYNLAHAALPGEQPAGAHVSARVWARLNRRPTLRTRALGGVAVPAAVGLLNRLGLGPFTRDLSPASLRRSGLRALSQVLDGLGVRAAHVVFGHTHRAGPLPRDGAAADWRGANGTALVNTGSWVYAPRLASRSPDSPYWPGRGALVGDEGAPRLLDLLAGASHEDLAREAPEPPSASPG